MVKDSIYSNTSYQSTKLWHRPIFTVSFAELSFQHFSVVIYRSYMPERTTTLSDPVSLLGLQDVVRWCLAVNSIPLAGAILLNSSIKILKRGHLWPLFSLPRQEILLLDAAKAPLLPTWYMWGGMFVPQIDLNYQIPKVQVLQLFQLG